MVRHARRPVFALGQPGRWSAADRAWYGRHRVAQAAGLLCVDVHRSGDRRASQPRDRASGSRVRRRCFIPRGCRTGGGPRGGENGQPSGGDCDGQPARRRRAWCRLDGGLRAHHRVRPSRVYLGGRRRKLGRVARRRRSSSAAAGRRRQHSRSRRSGTGITRGPARPDGDGSGRLGRSVERAHDAAANAGLRVGRAALRSRGAQRLVARGARPGQGRNHVRAR